MNHRHLSEDQLVALSASEALPAEFAACRECLARRHSMAQTLREVADVATIAVDAQFPPERLARQRARILARIERYGQRARVLAFPSQPAHRPTLRQPRRFRRWVAAAAVAGLVVGLFAGRTVHDVPSLHVPMRFERAPASFPVPLRASSDPLADEEFLREVEDAVGSAGPSALRRIEDVTPVAWDGE
jgi:hypothetical protein